MLDPTMIELSRWQFAITALYHFLFVPLNLGLTWILVIMESVYVMTGKEIYRHMTKFWGKLFGIPDQEARETTNAIKIPWALGLIATRSLNEEVSGLKDIMHNNEARIRSGMTAYEYLQRLRSGEDTEGNRAMFEEYKADLVYLVTNTVTFRVRLWGQCKARSAGNGRPFTRIATQQWPHRHTPSGRARKRSSATLCLLERACHSL